VDKLYTGLLEILEKQLKIYQTMYSLAQQKQPVLIKGNIPELERLTNEEELLIIQVGRLETERISFHQAIASHFMLSPEELNLAELIKRSGEENGKVFQQLFDKMTNVLKLLAEINQNNTELIKSSLDYINISLDVLTDLDKSPSYNDKDEINKNSMPKIFDHKI
jgi:flagellar biosynthesis/type III secretory pathway chaperone